MALTQSIQKSYISILSEELIPAAGCTEPIAIAYAAAAAAEVLGVFPEHIELYCSGNVIKNVKGVVVPNSGGLRGAQIAAILGVVGGKAEKKLEVLHALTPGQIERAAALNDAGFCSLELAEVDSALYIRVKLLAGSDTSEAEIEGRHTNLTCIKRNGVAVSCEVSTAGCISAPITDRRCLNIADIVEFANTVDIAGIRGILQRQAKYNESISREGMKHEYGACVGRTLLEYGEMNVRTRAAAYAAAGSDARMSGCKLPGILNSGSGNQGMTVSLPVIEYARSLGLDENRTLRALAVSNLVAIRQKSEIGALSAYCGAVSAACGSGAAITYMCTNDVKAVESTITNTLACISGMLCDGAKPSCAAKIAAAVNTAIMAHELTMRNRGFHSGEGIVKADVEATISGICRIAREGMRDTDTEILDLMIQN